MPPLCFWAEERRKYGLHSLDSPIKCQPMREEDAPLRPRPLERCNCWRKTLKTSHKMILRKKRLLIMYMLCIGVACLVAYNLLPPIQRDPPSFYHKSSANDSNDLTILLDQIDQPHQVQPDQQIAGPEGQEVSSPRLEDCSVWIPSFKWANVLFKVKHRIGHVAQL